MMLRFVSRARALTGGRSIVTSAIPSSTSQRMPCNRSAASMSFTSSGHRLEYGAHLFGEELEARLGELVGHPGIAEEPEEAVAPGHLLDRHELLGALRRGSEDMEVGVEPSRLVLACRLDAVGDLRVVRVALLRG